MSHLLWWVSFLPLQYWCRHRVKHRPNEAFHEDCAQYVIKAQGGFMTLWRCFTYSVLDSFFKVNKTLNQHSYIQILNEQALPFSYYLCKNSLTDMSTKPKLLLAPLTSISLSLSHSLICKVPRFKSNWKFVGFTRTASKMEHKS